MDAMDFVWVYGLWIMSNQVSVMVLSVRVMGVLIYVQFYI